MSEAETQTDWQDQWDKEKLEALKIAIQHSRIECEANGEDPFERETKDQ